ncbi:MAG: 2-C-methyl-D-erythritol 4-phosphate cytidylyltransferase [Candidatus Edwardsbacteria bacterium RIFOXYD12_FULL_50_11]|uniref:2-C-methyl-D-erythritol 4-phosphate cytidylyltransferase n=1 Tax=Candidatus Edwardsbacteria bacterium GWF2_54_11 TaxID=1817851 RepID=A0A1F5RFB5_9BACT|nr:MAG: 2-C-methyl-D-erythritol 4-phosphate cytidylyltransferase [Candidatus Edwardsbacteria bacterium RifOxyC12_full_54_24]OGF08229.1 MAG: 2-C-methyl-D-erythritol 4-phosphate cytidylyltransferase [Candidatus Edwardsbacteria bacterium RifOxyA12_full_54_48]OGF11526.1 MAG: 2-C-methyl-D-erythritol 4-phosphate cytidylyltransferase [Candidatus Edwardsbacteria bacterium GWE2_54_12]OGF12731.1 MAG: 2-C-methyl-D-erythritol 4-phosphate cytidylyltransferase [Candidatus Edwardsbacteria bacterium GWF2_54_11]
MFVSCIIVAAGSGLRLGAKIPKAFVKINGKPMLEYSLEAYQDCKHIKEIILVKPPSHQFKGLKYFDRFSKLAAIVSGGKERLDSVRAGLNSVSPQADMVMIHDAARPLIRPEQIHSVISAVKKHGAAILASPVTDTIKSADKHIIKRTVDRAGLWKAQTPQGFRKEILERSHFDQRIRSVTDDSQLVEMIKGKVFIVPGDDSNIKITTPIDLEIASCLLKKKRSA